MEAEAEAGAEEAMQSAEGEAALQEAENAERMANDGVGELPPEELEKRQAENNKAQVAGTKGLMEQVKLSEGVDTPTSEQISKLQDTSTELANSVEVTGDILPKLDEAAGKMDEETANRLNSSMRPFFETMASKIESLIKDSSGEEKLTEFKNLESKLTEAIENRDPKAYEEATKNLDSFIDESLGESKTALEEKTEGKGNLKNFSRIASFLKLLGIIGLLGLLTALFKMDNGCWKWNGGAKTQKINDFDFSKNGNKKFCACSDTSDFETPQPLSSWCPSGVSKGNPNYVTCPPYQYPVCTIKTDSSGIYYSYYLTSPLGVFNSLVNQTSKVLKKGGRGLLNLVKWVVVIICIFISLYFIYKGIVDKKMLYAIGVLLIAGAGTASWFLI